MQIVLSDEDLQKMPLNLRECLKAFVFGEPYGELLEALGNPGDGKGIDPLAALDGVTLEELYNGINEAGREILHVFAEKDGTVQAGEFMEALGLEEPRQLTGPLGGITRKLRSMFGADVSLWSYDKQYQTYLLPESHVYILRRNFGLPVETESDRNHRELYEYQEWVVEQEEQEKREQAKKDAEQAKEDAEIRKIFKTGDEEAIQKFYDKLHLGLMDMDRSWMNELTKDDERRKNPKDVPRHELDVPRHELTEEEFELCHQFVCAVYRNETNVSTKADQKFLEKNRARYRELHQREWDRKRQRGNRIFEKKEAENRKLEAELSKLTPQKDPEEIEKEKEMRAIRDAIREKKDQARERYRNQIKKKYAKNAGLEDLGGSDPSTNEKKGA